MIRRPSDQPARRKWSATFLLLAFLPVISSCKDSTGAPIPFRLVISPSNASMDALGLTQQFSATVEDKKGKPIIGIAISWSSSDQGVASVSTSGLVTGLRRGTTTITATAEGLSDQVSVTVNPIPVRIAKVSGDDQTGTLNQTLDADLLDAQHGTYYQPKVAFGSSSCRLS